MRGDREAEKLEGNLAKYLHIFVIIQLFHKIHPLTVPKRLERVIFKRSHFDQTTQEKHLIKRNLEIHSYSCTQAR